MRIDGEKGKWEKDGNRLKMEEGFIGKGESRG